MRKILTFSALGSLLIAPLAFAAPPVPCNSDPVAGAIIRTNCIQDEIFILDGNEKDGADAVVACTPKTEKNADGTDKKDPVTGLPVMIIDPPQTCGDWTLSAPKAVNAALKKFDAPPDGWDEIVVFWADMAKASNPTGPLFYRTKNGQTDINEVKNIGLTVVPRPTMGRLPYIGFIDAAPVGLVNNSNNMIAPAPAFAGNSSGTNPESGQYVRCGSGSTQRLPALCAPGFYSFFDALAQTTAALYGPYIGIRPQMGPQDISTWPLTKTGLVVTKTGESAVSGVFRPRVWNSLLNLGGSILGGSNWRDNGNGTVETTSPLPYYGVSGARNGSQILRFHELELYLMGMVPKESVPDIESYMDAVSTDVVKPTTFSGAFSEVAGPQMNLRRGVALKVTIANKKKVTIGEIVGVNGGERDPAYAKAPRYLRQLWVAVTRPWPMQPTTISTTDFNDFYYRQDRELSALSGWRRQWNAYFYMLTRWRGRMISSFDGKTDDTPYWEFGDPAEDAKSFKQDGGLKADFQGPIPVANSSDISTALRVHETPGQGGVITYNNYPTPLRIDGDQKIPKAPLNIVTVRMRIPASAYKAYDPKKVDKDGKPAPDLWRSFATVTFTAPGKNVSVRIPNNDQAFLIPDGKWRNYSASLQDNKDFTSSGDVFTGLKFQPSSLAFKPDQAVEGIDIEFLRIQNVLPANAGDTDKDCAGKAKPDGWVDAEDNCKAHYNPLQEDGNEDGVGDACEDFDGDTVVNLCDNCPTVTNSRQRDQDGDGIGDVCDEATPTGCFLQPDSLAGPVRSGASTLGAVILFGVMGLACARRMRRRK